MRKVLDRERAVALWLDGNTCKVVAEEIGCTGERVRQIVRDDLPRSIFELRQQRQAARRRLQAMAIVSEEPDVPCRVCGVMSYERYCRPRCRRLWLGRLSNHVASATDYRRDWFARRRGVRATYDCGSWKSRPRSFVQRGSGAHEAATLAYRNGWPVFDELTPEIQDQIRAEAAA